MNLLTLPPNLELNADNLRMFASEGYAMSEVLMITGWTTREAYKVANNNDIKLPVYSQQELHARDVRSVHHHMGLGCSEEVHALIRGKWSLPGG